MIITESDYKSKRESYCYYDRDCQFQVLDTVNLDHRFTGQFKGIFPNKVPPIFYNNGINLRRFEKIVQAVFADAIHAESDGNFTFSHEENLKEITCAIVHWKMASQGGRADLKANNVRRKWRDTTTIELINAYREKKMELFEIGGIRIPTATAFMRFLFPDEYGIMDSRVAEITQKRGITSLNIRNDKYINDMKINKLQYNEKYNPFLVNEAHQLNISGVQFKDIDENGDLINSSFRPCDIEMALFSYKDQEC